MAGVNLHGKWELKKDRSESLYAHMKAMGCDEIAALASEKLDINLNIVQTEGDNAIKIYQTSQLGTTMRLVVVGEEIPDQFTQFERQVRVTPAKVEGNAGLLIETTFKTGHLKDYRAFLENGNLMKSTLELSMKNASGPPIRTVRFFQRISDQPDPEMMARVSNVPEDQR